MPVIQKFYFHCLENLKAPVVLVNVTRLKENLLKLASNLQAISLIDEHIFLHAKKVAKSNSKILVKTVDSDAAVIAT